MLKRAPMMLSQALSEVLNSVLRLIKFALIVYLSFVVLSAFAFRDVNAVKELVAFCEHQLMTAAVALIEIVFNIVAMVRDSEVMNSIERFLVVLVMMFLIVLGVEIIRPQGRQRLKKYFGILSNEGISSSDNAKEEASTQS